MAAFDPKFRDRRSARTCGSAAASAFRTANELSPDPSSTSTYSNSTPGTLAATARSRVSRAGSVAELK